MQTPRIKLVYLLEFPYHGEDRSGLRVKGWVRTCRDNKRLLFIELNDGSCVTNLQVVCPATLPNFGELRKLTTGSAVEIVGDLVDSPAAGQKVELRASEVLVIHLAGSDYPMQKKAHSLEYLREQAHLRVRTNTFGAVFRIRSYLAQAIHHFFRARRFAYVHTPIITSSDCEGAGEMFQVTTLRLGDLVGLERHQDFFGKPTYLTVSGQLAGEAMVMGLGDIYTFGPTFRAENSNTSRHAAEFWMVEPEMAFADLDDAIDLAGCLLHNLLIGVCTEHGEDLACLGGSDLRRQLEDTIEARFERMTYTEAIRQLEQSGQKFEFPVHWGANLQAEHERYLTEVVLGRPVFVTDYPKEIKAFYMRRNDDGKTVAAMDLLVPKVGELIGGSQREERFGELLAAIVGIHPDDTQDQDYAWYLDTRRHGSVPHSGFGLGFERLVMFVTGMENIRDVIPFPRTPRNCSG